MPHTHTHSAIWLALFLLLLPVRAWPQDADKSASEEGSGKVSVVQNVGGHTGAIQDLAFSPDARFLYTVGHPGEVAEWSVQKGQRLRVWRFPSIAQRLALSADGKRLAVIALHKTTVERKAVWTIDLPDGVVRMALPDLPRTLLYGMSLSPDGKRLAYCMEDQTKVQDLVTGKQVGPTYATGKALSVTFSPDGLQLLTATDQAKNRRILCTWPVGRDSKGVLLPGADVQDPLATWSRDGKQVAAMHGDGQGSLRVWSVADRKVIWEANPRSIRTLLGDSRGRGWAVGMAFVSPEELVACWVVESSLRAVVVNPGKNIVTALPLDIPQQQPKSGKVAFSADGRWLAATDNPGFRIALYDLKLRKVVARLGPTVDVPQAVGWTETGLGIAWGPTRQTLSVGIDLLQLERLDEKRLANLSFGGLPKGWKIKHEQVNRAFLLRGKQQVQLSPYDVSESPALVFKDTEKKDRLLVVANNRKQIVIVDPETGKDVGKVGALFSRITDMAISPDQKYLLVACGEPVLRIYNLAKPRYNLLYVLPKGQDWIAWPRGGDGYYAGTPGAEQLIGFKVATSSTQEAKFYPVEQFRTRRYVPEVVREVMKTGRMAGVVKKVSATRKVEPVESEDLLPPTVTILGLRQDGKNAAVWHLKVRAASNAKKQPLTELRLSLDGGTVATRSFDKELLEATWDVTVPVPSGKHTLKVLARCPDVAGISDGREVKVAVPDKERPGLHLLAVGIDKFGNAAFDLDCAGADARAITRELPRACVGPANLFGTTRSTTKLLLDGAATAKDVERELLEMKKRVRPGDLAVIFFAGHGMREEGEFYLITAGSRIDSKKDLDTSALSGKRLSVALGNWPCRVLLLLDACHSGQGARVLRSPVDDASRGLANEDCTVTILSATLGHQRAAERLVDGKKAGHGLFTEALLSALEAQAKVPLNEDDGRQYVHHLFSHVFDKVQKTSKGKQHPMLSLPWTIESFAVRQVRKGQE